jgi:hypothetical protein
VIAMVLFVCLMPTALAYGVVNSVNGGDMTAVQHVSVSDNTHSMHDYLTAYPVVMRMCLLCTISFIIQIALFM